MFKLRKEGVKKTQFCVLSSWG